MQKKIFIILVLLISTYFILIFNDVDKLPGYRWLQDECDRRLYYETWIALTKSSGRPGEYGVISSYPPLGLASFGLPFIFRPTPDEYVKIFALFMLVIFLSVVFLLLKISQKLKTDYWHLLILICPAMLYFSLNRFDLLPVLFTLLSLWLLLKKKNNLAFFFLGLGFMTKLYPIIYLPLYLNYIYLNQGTPGQKWKALVKPTLIFLLAASFTLVYPVYILGIRGILRFLNLHWIRPGNSQSLFSFVEYAYLKNRAGLYSAVKYFFFILQFIFIPCLLIKGIKKQTTLIASMGVVTLMAITFSRFYSPQWIIWVNPLLLLLQDKITLFLLIIYDLLTFLYFPLSGLMDFSDFAFQIILLLNIAIKITIIFWLFKRWLYADK